MGGAGSAVSECLRAHNIHIPVLHLGLPDTFIEHGNSAEMLKQCGLGAVGIVKQITQHWEMLEISV